MKHIQTSLLLGITIVIAACAPWSTYPPVETSARIVKPTYEPIPTVIAAAVKYVQDKYFGDARIAINMPEGSPPELYEKVFQKLGYGRPMEPADDIAIHVVEARTRDFNAQVDVIYVNRDGFNQFATLNLHRSLLEQYAVTRERIWRFSNVETPPSHYAAAPEPIAPE